MKKLSPVSLKNVTIHDPFWSQRQDVVRNTVIPYQWDALNDNIPGVEPSHTIENFRIAAGEAEGEYYGMVFQDSDLAKWLETVGYALATERDEQLEKIADEAIDLIGRAQQPDGYLNTYFTVAKPDQRWTNLRDDHELYCAGHMIEAAVAYYKATGKRKLLDIMCKMVDHIDSVIGNEEGKIPGYPGHPEIELALLKLYEVTKDPKHLELSRYFIEQRGQEPNFFIEEAKKRGEEPSQFHNSTYSQCHLPVREQKTAEGHAVRAVYLYSSMVDLAAETNDPSLFEACKTLWHNITRNRMYVTGGIGSSSYREAFTVDYDLPNDRAYAETCAAIGLMFFAHRMQQVEPNREYADVAELALYNGILSGMSLDGKSYFYVNPLEVWPDTALHRNDMRHVKTVRQGWFECACCPPNIARLIASLGEYIYSTNEKDNELYIHHYIGSDAQITLGNTQVKLSLQSKAPWDELKTVQLSLSEAAEFTLALRWPGWCRDVQVSVNGEAIGAASVLDENGYLKITRIWNDNDQLEIRLSMPVEVVRPHPEIRVNAGKVALKKGPLVFCLEEIDNGKNLPDLSINRDSSFQIETSEALGGVPVIVADGKRSDTSKLTGNTLYFTEALPTTPATIKAIPYFAWANRGQGEMLVWIREA